MDVGLIRAIITLILLIAFIALVFWAWSDRPKKVFDEASRLPLDDSNESSE